VNWQEAVNMAWAVVCVHDMRQYGLLEGGPQFDLEQADALLAQGRERQVFPNEAEVYEIIAVLIGPPDWGAATGGRSEGRGAFVARGGHDGRRMAPMSTVPGATRDGLRRFLVGCRPSLPTTPGPGAKRAIERLTAIGCYLQRVQGQDYFRRSDVIALWRPDGTVSSSSAMWSRFWKARRRGLISPLPAGTERLMRNHDVFQVTEAGWRAVRPPSLDECL
jgi:hypothetical protein